MESEVKNTVQRTAIEYCRSVVPSIRLEDDVLYTIFYNRGVDMETLLDDLDKKTRDLLTADCYKKILLMPSTTSQVKDSDGNWSHSEGGMRLTTEDKRNLRLAANELYRLYGESEISGSQFKIFSNGIGNIKRPMR